MRVTLLALLALLVACTGTDKGPAATDSAGDSGAVTGDDTGTAAAPGCVLGALRSEDTIEVYGEVDDITGDIPLAGVDVRYCGDGVGGPSVEGGVWTVQAPDAEYVTVLAEIDGALPAQWLFDPRVEGVPEMPYRADMIWEEFAVATMAEVGVTRDPAKAVVIIEAMDPDTRADLAGVVVTTDPQPESHLTISIEGPPVLANTTNGVHDVAALNVTPGPVSLVVDAGAERTCRIPDAIEVPAGGLLAVTAYCSLVATER